MKRFNLFLVLVATMATSACNKESITPDNDVAILASLKAGDESKAYGGFVIYNNPIDGKILFAKGFDEAQASYDEVIQYNFTNLKDWHVPTLNDMNYALPWNFAGRNKDVYYWCHIDGDLWLHSTSKGSAHDINILTAQVYPIRLVLLVEYTPVKPDLPPGP